MITRLRVAQTNPVRLHIISNDDSFLNKISNDLYSLAHYSSVAEIKNAWEEMRVRTRLQPGKRHWVTLVAAVDRSEDLTLGDETEGQSALAVFRSILAEDMDVRAAHVAVAMGGKHA